VIAKSAFFSALLLAFAPFAFSDGMAIYSTIPSSLPPNMPSLGYEATSTAELGGLIEFAGNSPTYTLTSATVAMSDWAVASDWALNGSTITANGFYVPLTLNLYDVGTNNTVGALIASETVDALIPWRPEATTGCWTGYLGSDGQCYNGSLSTVTFNLIGVTAPDEIIYGLAFNTTDHGADPTGVPGPYDSLNFGLSNSSPTVGGNPLPGVAYWNTTAAGDYADGGAGGVGTFRQDQNWSPYTGGITFDEPEPTPESSPLLLLGTGLLALAGVLWRRSRSARS
jgi:hypothetical protein